MRKAKDESDLSQCTFKPKINPPIKKIQDRSRSQDVSSRLYSHAMNKLFRIKSIYEERNSLDQTNEKESKECTFSPRLTNL